MRIRYKRFGLYEGELLKIVSGGDRALGFETRFSVLGRGYSPYTYVYENQPGEVGLKVIALRVSNLDNISSLNHELYELLLKNVDIIHLLKGLLGEDIFFIKELDFKENIFPYMDEVDSGTIL